MSVSQHRQIFVSAVSKEFRSYRELLASDMKRPNLDIKIQEDFGVFGTHTLEKSDAYIRHCHAVIHLVGDSTGAVPLSPEVAAIKAKYPDLAMKVPTISDVICQQEPAISYTQWEAYLGVYHRRELYIYRPIDGTPQDHGFIPNSVQQISQENHFRRLCELGRDRGTVSNQERLSSAGLRDLVEILPRLESISEPRWGIPRSDSELYGRDDDVARLRDLIGVEKRGLTTIIGPGGIGKTRIACEVGADLQNRFPGGGYFVELKELESLPQITVAIADVLGLRLDQKGDPVTVLADMLRSRPPTLLILDNFEHVADLATHSIKIWRGAAPAVSILVTSRRSLGLTGESVFALESLSLPRFEDIENNNIEKVFESASVKLFIATAADQGVVIKPDGLAAFLLTDICRNLDGHPLAIILVARRVLGFSLEELCAEVQTNRTQAAHAHGQALEDTILWSYRLLDEATQEAFLRVCVFREGFDRAAAESLLADLSKRCSKTPMHLLQLLCEWSLVQSIRRGPLTRYQLFQTIQDFGRIELSARKQDAWKWSELWLEHYTKVSERLSPMLVTANGNKSLSLLVEERENILAAYEWGLTNTKVSWSARLIVAFAPVLLLRGPWQIQCELYRRAL